MSSAPSTSARRRRPATPSLRPLCKAGKRLDAWLSKEKCTRQSFADRIGVDRETLWRWMVGNNPPGISYAAAIEKITHIPARVWAEG